MGFQYHADDADHWTDVDALFGIDDMNS